MKRISFKVTGRVQGVGYRATTANQATSLGITGFVQNNSDGTVSGEAQGSEDKLKEFVQQLNKGPRHALVESVNSDDIGTKEGEDGFRGG